MAGLRLLEEYLNREFGPLDEGDLQHRTQKRAEDIAASVPQVRANEVLNQGDTQQGIPDWTARPGAEPTNDNFLGEDTLRMLGAGVADLGSSLVGVPEYVARQNKFLRPTVAPALESARHGIEGMGQDILKGVSPDFLAASGREFLTLDPNKTVWQGSPLEVGEAVYGKFVRSIPSTLAMMIPAVRWFRAGSTAGALAYMGATEGAMSLGQVQSNIADEISGMTKEDLLRESPRFAELMDEYQGDETRARQDLTAEAQGAAPLIAGATVAAISASTGRMLTPIFTEGGMPFARRFGTGAAEEFLQESTQSGAEQLAQNYAAQIYDRDRPMTQGVGEQMIQGGAIGALSGGVFGGAFGERPPAPLPSPIEGAGGQLGLPGIGPAQPGPEPPAAPPAAPEGAYVPNTGMGQQTEFWPDPGTTGAVAVPQEQAPGQGVLPLGIAATEPLSQRGPNHRVLREGDIPEALDQPTAEPQVDIQAQIDDMKGAGGRSAVYLSPQQVRTQNITLPKNAVVIPNFDGKGGRLIAKNQEAANYARKRRGEGGSMQAIIGELTLAGTGKPNVRSGYAVQKLGEGDAVARESLVATKAEATALAKEWGGNTRVLSGEEALARRSDLLEQEQTNLRTEDRTKVDEATGDLFEQRPEPLTAGENQSTTNGFLIQMKDDAGNLIVEEQVGTQEEADARADELSKDFPDANIVSKPFRVAANVSKMGVTAANRVQGKVLKGPPEGPPPRPSAEREVSKSSTRPTEVSVNPSSVEPFNPDQSVKDIENLPDFEVDYPVITETPQANGSIQLTESRAQKSFTSRTAAKAFATRAYNNAVAKAGPDFGVRESKVSAIESPELEAQFQSAVQARADRKQTLTFPKEREQGKPVTPDEAASDENELISKWRTQNRTPSQKVQFIRRERASQLRRRGEVKNVRATTVTRVDKGGKPVETKTEPLTYETVSGEETVAQKTKREHAVKEANKRLMFARNRANKFLERFDNAGVYGTYAAENTNLDGSLTDEGIEFVKARDAFHQLVELANSILTSGNKSNAHATLAKQIAISLERIKLKSMTPEQFAKEFSAIADKTEYKMLKTVPVQFRESASTRDQKIAKLNAERASANERKALLEKKWRKDKAFTEVIAPIFRKFSETSLLNAANPAKTIYYKPTNFEIENLAYVMRAYRAKEGMYSAEEFYKPIREQLEYYGFEFNENGDLIVQPFSPSENLLGPSFLAKHGVSKAAVGEVAIQETAAGIIDRAAKVQNTPVVREQQDINDQRRAVRNVQTANALIRKFKDMSKSAKVTINGIKRQEQRLIRGLRKIGAWVDVSPTMGRISIGGYKSKTYRLVGPRLDARTMLKADAKNFIQRLAEIPMPRELMRVSNQMGGVEQTAQSIVDENQRDFFLEQINPVASNSENLKAANDLGDLLQSGVPLDGNVALQTVWQSLPKGSFYRQAIERIINYNFGEVGVAYGDTSDFAGGEYGKFSPSSNMVLLNREAMQESFGDRIQGTRAMHAFVHEMYHAATHIAIRKSPALREAMAILRGMVSTQFRQETTAEGLRGPVREALPYGLQSAVQLKTGEFKARRIDEFVVEAFSDPELQELMKRTRIPDSTQTMWERFKGLVLRVFGIESTGTKTAWDAILSVEDVLFEHAGESGSRNAEDMHMESLDHVLRGVATNVLNRSEMTNSIYQRVKERLKNSFNRFNAAAYNIMTMEQFREAYDKFFEGRLGKYVESFNRRNASATQYMQVPQDLSNDWTRLETSNPEAALAMSQLMTDATLNKQSVDTEGEYKTRFDALPAEAQRMYLKVRDYYKDAVAKEKAFLLQAALRGITGVNFTEAQLAEVNTKADVRKLLEPHINELEIADVADTLTQMANTPTQKQGDYFPLMRYGDHVVIAEKQRPSEFFEDRKGARARRAEIAAEDPTLDVQYKEAEDGRWEVRTFEREFVMAETASEAATEYERLKQEYGEANVKDPDLRRSRTVEAAIGSNAQLNSILKTLEGNTAAQAAIKNFYLRSLSETSMRKHEIRRKNRRGVRRDLQHRNLAAYAKQASYYTAQLQHGWKMADAISDMDEFVSNYRQGASNVSKVQLRSVLQHLQKRDQMGTDLPDINNLVRRGVEGTHFFMLTSPSYWAINATQPWMITLPTMASKFGWGQSMSAMKDIQSLIAPKLLGQVKKSKGGLATFKNRVLTEETFNVLDQVEQHIKDNAPGKYAEYKTLLDELRDRHIIDINVFTEMREVAAGKTRSNWANMVDASRIMAHLTEVNNRVLTALSAYQLAINSGMSVDDAKVYAGDMVSQTQFNYSSQNKPPLFQSGGPIGGVAPLVFQFMQWPQHMYAHLIRNFARLASENVITRQEARKAVLGLLATHAAVGGLAGMMLQPIKWAFGLAMMALGDDDDPNTLANALSGDTFDRTVAGVTNDLFGTHVSTAVTKGLPAALGVDLSSRMSMGTFYFVDLRADNAQSVLGSLVASFGGATLNQGVKMAQGLGQVMDGDLMKGIETASPKMARDVLRAVRYYREGMVNNSGDTVIDASEMSPYELLAQTFGFQPTRVSNFYSAQNAMKDAEQYTIGRRNDLIKRFRNADTQADRREVQNEIREFNQSNPQERITASSLVQNIAQQKRREARYKRYGANIDERKARFYQEYGAPYK